MTPGRWDSDTTVPAALRPISRLQPKSAAILHTPAFRIDMRAVLTMAGTCCDAAMGLGFGLKLSLIRLTPRQCGVASALDRDKASHASRARAGRSRQCQSKWGDSTR